MRACVCVCVCAFVHVCVRARVCLCVITCMYDRYDFFLVSQSVNQGTVSPTHFNVVVDGGGLKPDHMQRLTYKLCHLYYNWPVCYVIILYCLLTLNFVCFIRFLLTFDYTVVILLFLLLGNCSSASAMPICSQTSIPGWTVDPQGASSRTGRQTLLPVIILCRGTSSPLNPLEISIYRVILVISFYLVQ